MSFASTKAGGTCFAFPDTCKVPASPAPPIPTPFPNTGMLTDATGATCTLRVKIMNKAVLHKSSEIARTMGDEAGTLKGVVSSTNMDKAVYRSASVKVKVEGVEIVMHLCMTAHNGSNANAPPGTQVAPSQTKVIVGA